MILDFFKGKRVFVTGHTGFKGTWLCKVLLNAGADITGYSLSPTTEPNLYDVCDISQHIRSNTGDVRDAESLFKAFRETKPDIVFHLAAQPIVLKSYEEPVDTFCTNIMGTVNLLDAVRQYGAESIVNITTDKVYANNEWLWGYRETDSLGGHDPYSSSKSCSELVTQSYKKSFLDRGNIAVSTARAGNVIGGGDFSENRIIPDCIRFAQKSEPIIVRNPNSIRPYQHVLEPVYAYLLIAKMQCENDIYSDCYNIGPDECDCITTGELVDLFCKKWGNGLKWERKSNTGPHEAGFLKLDCSKIKTMLKWQPLWNIDYAIEKTIDWTRVFFEGGSTAKIMEKQIIEYLNF